MRDRSAALHGPLIDPLNIDHARDVIEQQAPPPALKAEGEAADGKAGDEAVAKIVEGGGGEGGEGGEGGGGEETGASRAGHHVISEEDDAAMQFPPPSTPSLFAHPIKPQRRGLYADSGTGYPMYAYENNGAEEVALIAAAAGKTFV